MNESFNNNDYEQEIAEFESARNKACDEYFEARPNIDNKNNRRFFDAGFKACWHVRNNK